MTRKEKLKHLMEANHERFRDMYKKLKDIEDEEIKEILPEPYWQDMLKQVVDHQEVRQECLSEECRKSLPEGMENAPMGISCPCPKCTPWSM